MDCDRAYAITNVDSERVIITIIIGRSLGFTMASSFCFEGDVSILYSRIMIFWNGCVLGEPVNKLMNNSGSQMQIENIIMARFEEDAIFLLWSISC